MGYADGHVVSIFSAGSQICDKKSKCTATIPIFRAELGSMYTTMLVAMLAMMFATMLVTMHVMHFCIVCM